MGARTIGDSIDARRILREGWKFCCTAPGECTTPEALQSIARSWHTATVPCTVASALRQSGLWSLDGPEQRFDATDWWFVLEFEVAAAVADDWRLEFDGLASLCDVWLNGRPLLNSANMFLSHSLRAEGLVQGRNVLHLVFRSLDAALSKRRPRPRWRVPMIENQQLRWFRTTVMGRTPGWSLPAAPVGPWRPVRLTRGPTAVSEVELRASVAGTTGMLRFAARTSLPASMDSPVLSIRRSGKIVASAAVVRIGDRLEARVELQDVDLWWPHTHGNPALYEAVLIHAEAPGRAALEQFLGRTGFRNISVIGQDVDGLALAVNGNRIFCRGACWTPLEPVALSASPADLRRALEQSVAAGFNMLRLSGTFVYEDEEFFMLCDELGVMIWQDFMFASMDYPAEDPEFLECIRNEAEQQLAIWHRHPSVAVICGNSEVSQQSAMWGRPREEWYPALFSETLRCLAEALCPEAIYWPSSASGGAFPHQPDTGTCSYYGVGAYMRDPIDARLSGVTFATECLAFANIPEDEALSLLPGGASTRAHSATWKRRSPRDLGAGWDFDDVRDHYVRMLFGMDPMQLRYSDHARFLVLGRQAVAEAMSKSFTQWRRRDSRCNGAIVWFLRDLWPGAGWGLIDARGNAKSGWYALRRELQPRWIGITDEGLNGIALHVVNEGPNPLEGDLHLTLYRDGKQILDRANRPIGLAPRSALSISATSMLERFLDLGHAYRFGPMSCDLIVASFRGDNEDPPLAAFHLPRTELHVQQRTDCVLQAQAQQLRDSGDYHLSICCSGFARGVHIDVPGYVASDQYFNLEPATRTTLRLRAISAGARPPAGIVSAINVALPATVQVSALQ
ncbi:MAG: hypothetical protein U1F39_06025 [Steroidobacteraceae bacterium]